MTELLTIHPLAPNLSPAQSRQASAPDMVNDQFFASFSDVLDTLNPLQHIPVVSTIYRQLTGDTLANGARVAGGALFGGPIGLLSSLIDSAVEGETGNDIGGNVFAYLSGNHTDDSTLANASDYIPSSQRAAINSYVRAQSLFS